MKTITKTKKQFDAVEFMRKRRTQISKDIDSLTPKEELKYFRNQALKLRKKK
jgi:hypothetical protein